MENRIKVMVAEDDERLRKYILSLLATFPEIEILQAAANGRELLDLAAYSTPDAVFLDVEMPELDGFSAAVQLLQNYPRLAVVFITGHVEEGIRGYDIGAADYLPKPVSRENLARSISRIKSVLALRNRQLKGNEEKLVIRSNRRVQIIDMDAVLFVERVNRMCVINTADGLYYSNESLDSLEAKLGDRFMRSHRGYIINIDRVAQIEQGDGNNTDHSMSVAFTSGNARALIAKKKLDELLMRLAGRLI